MADISEKIRELKNKFRSLATVFDLENKEKKLAWLAGKTQDQEFWENQKEAIRVSQEMESLKKEIGSFNEMREELTMIEELAGEEGIEKEIENLDKKLKEKETEVFLSGKYDKGNAILSIYSGAGGQDAQDWATMLLRMYQRYSEKRGFKNKILEQSFGEAGGPEGRIGTKSATLEIKGKFAYGFLRKETGVHRLVRISPFSAKSLRHTSFTLVEVLPEIGEGGKEINIRPEDLQIDSYHSSGPGGQYVNKKETAVRITHLPTGIIVTCQSERLQGDNKNQAMKILLGKLYALQQENKKDELKEIKGERISASWSNQIRNYVLHPYKMVKDLRTDIETSNPDKVLDGDLDKFIEAEIRI
ncbi:MAG: peptide chain release factor 2 [bacterium]|nr:peptide chain release factor 2 [bacterium]